jgi:hypothetical protein
LDLPLHSWQDPKQARCLLQRPSDGWRERAGKNLRAKKLGNYSQAMAVPQGFLSAIVSYLPVQ